MENLTDDADETKDGGVTATLKMLNNISYIIPILSQEDMVLFQILEQDIYIYIYIIINMAKQIESGRKYQNN